MSRRPDIALAAAGLGALGLLLDWVLAFHVGVTGTVDRQVLQGFAGLHAGRIGQLADAVPHLSDPQPFILLAGLIVAVALARRRRELALAAAALIAGANLGTQWLQPALATHRLAGLPAPSDVALWPSGHATASMSLCLAAVLVAPAPRRPLVAGLGAAYSLAVTFALLVGAWHLPSDVVAGYLMAGTWASLVVAAVWARDARGRAGARGQEMGVGRAVTPVAVVALVGVILAVLGALARPAAVEEYARAHTTFVVGAGLIAALALALAAGLSAAMTATRRPSPSGSGRAPTTAPRRRWRRARG